MSAYAMTKSAEFGEPAQTVARSAGAALHSFYARRPAVGRPVQHLLPVAGVMIGVWGAVLGTMLMLAS